MIGNDKENDVNEDSEVDTDNSGESGSGNDEYKNPGIPIERSIPPKKKNYKNPGFYSQ